MREREEDFQQEPLEGTEEDLSGKKMGVWFASRSTYPASYLVSASCLCLYLRHDLSAAQYKHTPQEKNEPKKTTNPTSQRQLSDRPPKI